MNQPHKLGDTVYALETLCDTVNVPCPDCLGSTRWIAILPNGEEFKVQCPSCTFGYRCDGTVPSDDIHGRVMELTIVRVCFDSGNDPEKIWTYQCEETGSPSGRIWYASLLFATHELAEESLAPVIEERRIERAEMNARQHKIRKSDRHLGTMVAHYKSHIRKAKRDLKEAEAGLTRETT